MDVRGHHISSLSIGEFSFNISFATLMYEIIVERKCRRWESVDGITLKNSGRYINIQEYIVLSQFITEGEAISQILEP